MILTAAISECPLGTQQEVTLEVRRNPCLVKQYAATWIGTLPTPLEPRDSHLYAARSHASSKDQR
jgi:hypothetical protein